MGKPRMTRADSWKKRDCVLRYRKFADELRQAVCGDARKKFSENAFCVSWTAYFQVPESWKTDRVLAHKGKIHQVKPDRDNVDKAILDSLFENDARISDAKYMRKRWDDGGGARIELEIL